METKLKIIKKEGVFKLTLPEGCTCVMVCLNKQQGLVPLHIESATNIKVDYIEKLLQDPEVSQITFIPINYNEYIHVLKEWRPIKCVTQLDYQ